MTDDRLPEVPRAFTDPRNLVTVKTFQRSAAERPLHETTESLSRWLVGPARRNPLFTEMFDEMAWRMVAAGIPLLRASLHSGTLHPQFLGTTYMWWRDTGETVKIMIAHEVVDIVPYSQNIVRRVREGGETLRRRIEDPDFEFDFTALRDVKARGATDYLALPVASQFGFGTHMAAYVSDRPGGFTDAEIAELATLSSRLSVIADMNSQRQIAENVVKTYLGPRTGPRVLTGQFRRGSGETILAVIWSSDLRRFTELSDHLPAERVIALLNELFDQQARAIADHGGEILKFVGDGLLAIFPVADPSEAPRAAVEALAAAREAQSTLSALRGQEAAELGSELEVVIALHYGAATYGNIGSVDRLDFTVIGPAVNLVSRIEAVGKSLDLPVIMSDDFAKVYGQRLKPLGLHKLRGLDQPHELFTVVD